jgi:uncharacterized protein YdiU (UPF0061 family)
MVRQVEDSCFSFVTPVIPVNPKVIHVADETAVLLGLSKEDATSKEFRDTFTGASVYPNTDPYAMCYGGHQFGNWAGQLGDGRAINLMEVEHQNKSWAVQLKGAGLTPYSRTADGLAVLRSSIREHLCAEAMFHLGVPTTRSLSLSLSGGEVLRDVMYNGNAAYEKGAIVSRVAPSFIRFGSFEIFSSRGDIDTLTTFTDYTIKTHYPAITEKGKPGYIAFFKQVVSDTLEMIIHWQRVGFVHGVMNTDNMSVHGITIDYGPYGWLEGYDQDWTPNTTDNQNRRYRFGNQPQVAKWNLYKLANAIYPLVDEAEPFQELLDWFDTEYHEKYTAMMRGKLGLNAIQESDKGLIETLEKVLQLTETDMTIFFRNLANISSSSKVNDASILLEAIQDAFYVLDEVKGEVLTQWQSWLSAYVDRLKLETVTDEERQVAMNKVNPKYVLRNYMAQLIIDEADKGDYSLIDSVYRLLKKPYNEQPENEKWFAKRPEWARSKVGCSMLSCSS